MSVVFHKATGGAPAIQLPNPALTNTTAVRKLGAQGRAAGGKRYYYSKGTTLYRQRWTWDAMPNEAKEALMLFFSADAEGPRYKFYLRDQDGRWWRAWFDQDELEFEAVGDTETSRGAYTVGGETFRTTTRQDPRWACEVELEVVSTTTTGAATTAP